MNKKQIRRDFRNMVFARDHYTCRVCGVIGLDRQQVYASQYIPDNLLDAHHITNKDDIPHGGYVLENGIALCQICHKKAGEHHATGTGDPQYSPDALYALIGSSYELAYECSERLESWQ